MWIAASLIAPIALGVLGCHGSDDGARASGSEPRSASVKPASPAPPPEGLRADLRLDAPGAWLGALRSSVGAGRFAALVPRDLSDLVDRLCGPVPDAVASRLRGRLEAVWLDRPASPGWACATGLEAEASDDYPLGVGVPVSAPDAAGVRRVLPASGATGGVTAAPAAPPVAFRGGVVVVASDVRALDASLSYLLARAAEAASPGSPGSVAPQLTVTWPEAVVGPSVRAPLAEAVRQAAGRARASISAERARHSRAPIVDPARLVDALDDAAQRALAFVPDLAGARLHVAPDASGWRVWGSVHVTPGSPLAARVLAAPESASLGVDALPGDVAAALLWPANAPATGDDADASDRVEALRRLAGSRLSQADAVVIERALASVRQASRGPMTLALGGDSRGAWLALGDAQTTAAPSRDALKAATRTDFAASASLLFSQN